MKKYKVIIGAGLYGLYAANYLKDRVGSDTKIIILECDPTPFRRATYINQARVHMGYHYPRSYSTAIKSTIISIALWKITDSVLKPKFDQVYATSSDFSWTNADPDLENSVKMQE